ncbi:MAG: glycosyltransferase family 4 protein [Isosphaeraceae bacterium]
MTTSEYPATVLVACPDARPPAYQAVIGLDRAGMLQRFLTGYYYRGPGRLEGIGLRLAPSRTERWGRTLRRRYDPEIPADRVRCAWSFDLALRIEARLAVTRPSARRGVARWRTRRFDRVLARTLERDRPAAALVFSDVGTEYALPTCRELGIPYVLSMVHGDVREERDVLLREAQRSPEFFPLYLGDSQLDSDELNWLHDRRLAELEAADRVLVPSDHIAKTLIREGTPPEKIAVIPYAADIRRFVPDTSKRPGEACTFLFAGGISQRKGVRYLLEAWRMARRPGWRLQLLGAVPRDPGPLGPLLEGVEVLGRVPHAEVPARMAAADVFVFPSLFEGSAVVTYEALACGLPSIVTPSAGSVVRDGREGYVVEPAQVEPLAFAMERLGRDPATRSEMARAARARAETFDWPRYHQGTARVLNAVARRAPAEGVLT